MCIMLQQLITCALLSNCRRKHVTTKLVEPKSADRMAGHCDRGDLVALMHPNFTSQCAENWHVMMFARLEDKLIPACSCTHLASHAVGTSLACCRARVADTRRYKEPNNLSCCQEGKLLAFDVKRDMYQ